MTRRLCLPLLSLLLLPFPPLSAQEAPPAAEPAPAETADVETAATGDDEEIFFETMEVNVVNVDVFVTDKKGEPVTGLTRDDFEVFEDGRQMAITNFYVVEGGERVGGDPAEAPPAEQAAPPAVPGLEQRAPVPDEQRLYLVVYVDNLNIRPFNRNRVFRRLREFLRNELGPDDRVMLVSYERSLHVRHHFTSDPELVAAALFELEDKSGLALQVDSERRDLLRDMEDTDSSGDIIWRVRQYAESRFSDLSFSIDAMKEIVDSLAGLPGRKALLYISDGIEMVPGEDLFHAISQRYQGAQHVLTTSRDYDLSRRYQQLASQASANRVTFYAIDAAGLRVSTTATVQMATAPTAGVMNFVDSVYTSNLQQPLLLMADVTGGQVIYNTNDVGPGLTKIARDFDTYYSLGYLPAHSQTGRLYKIKVELKNGKGYTVRHREGYRDKSTFSRMSDGTLSSQRYGFESNPLEVEFRLGEPQSVEKGQYDVPFMVAIPLDKIVLVPRAEVHEARLKLYFGAVDERGDFSDIQEVELPLRIPADKLEEGARQYFPFQDKLRMREGGHRVVVGVWDEWGAAGSFVGRSLVVGG